MTTAVALKVIIVDYGAGNLRSVARAVQRVTEDPTFGLARTAPADAAPHLPTPTSPRLTADVTTDPRALDGAGALIVPGVGAAADTMRNLKASGMVEPIRDYIASGRPFLGVCMGQQALLSVSEEGGEHECLNIIPGRVKKLRPNADPPGAGVLEDATSGEARGIIPGRVKKLQPNAGPGRSPSPQSLVPSPLKIPHMGWNTVKQLPHGPQGQPHPIFEGIPDEAYFYFVHSYAPYPDDPSVVIGETTYGDPAAGGTFASVLAKDNIVATQFHPEKSATHGLRLYANFLGMVVGQ